MSFTQMPQCTCLNSTLLNPVPMSRFHFTCFLSRLNKVLRSRVKDELRTSPIESRTATDFRKEGNCLMGCSLTILVIDDCE